MEEAWGIFSGTFNGIGFKKTGDFPLYCKPVDTYRASCCDQSNLGD